MEKLQLKGWVVNTSASYSGGNIAGSKQRKKKKIENHGPTEGVKAKDSLYPQFRGKRLYATRFVCGWSGVSVTQQYFVRGEARLTKNIPENQHVEI